MNHNLVSIIVPVYGVEQYLEECVDSLLAQTHKDFELILVDDASPDSCGAICDSYAAKDSRVSVIHQKNGGAASARNTGLDTAKGDYICFVDSDDAVAPNYVSELIAHMESSYSDIAVCGFHDYSKLGKSACTSREPAGIYTCQEYLQQILLNWTCALLWNKMFRREVVGSIRIPEGHRIDDEFFTYQVVLNAKKIIVFDTPLYHYRLRRSSVMQNSNNEKIILDRIDYVQKRYSHICKLAPELKPAFFADMVDTFTRFWAGCENNPKSKQQLISWKKHNLRNILFSEFSLKQKAVYIYALYFKKAGTSYPLSDSMQPESFFD